MSALQTDMQPRQRQRQRQRMRHRLGYSPAQAQKHCREMTEGNRQIVYGLSTGYRTFLRNQIAQNKVCTGNCGRICGHFSEG